MTANDAPTTEESSCVESPSLFGAANDGMGGFGAGMKQEGGRFRLTKSGSLFSPKFYESDFARGNQYMVTRSMYGVGRRIAAASTVINIGQAVVEVVSAGVEEGGVGPRTFRAFGRAVGSYLGSTGGAMIGGALSVEGGPLGVLLGSASGAATGGAVGSHIGNEIVHGIQDRNLPPGVRSCQ